MDFFTNVSVPRAPAALGSLGSFGISTTVLYALLALFVLATVFMLLDIKIPWAKLNPFPRRTTVLAKAYKFWPSSGEFTNLKVDTPPKLGETSWTMTLECILFNTRNYTTTEGPYRQIAHRGSGELVPTTLGGFVKGCGAADSYGDLPPFGLPKRMNPGIFLDPNKNDIIVFVDTLLGGKTLRESLRISDIPMDIPFRLGIVLSGQVLEVYFNCGLEFTKLLKGVPREVDNKWYGIAGSASADAQIQNLYLWDFPLTADDIRPLCPGPPTFSKLRPSCNGADQAIPKPSTAPNTGAPDPNKLDLGLGFALNTCPQ